MNRRIILLAAVMATPLLAQEPTAKEAFDVAKQLYDNGEWADALVAFQKFERDQEFSTALPEAIYYEGWCCFKLKRYQDAATAFERVVKAYPSAAVVPGAMLKRAESFRELTEVSKAVDLYREFQSKYPKHLLLPQAVLGEAWARFKLKEFADAKAIVARAREDYRDDPIASFDALCLLGQILNEEGNLDEARAVYREITAQRADPRAAECLYLAGESMFEVKRYADAITYYQLQAQINERPDLRAAALFRLGNCYQALGKPDEASVAYRDLLGNYPDDKLAEQANVALIQTLIERHQFEDANAETEKFKQKYPKSRLIDNASFLQAETLFGRERYEDALNRYLTYRETAKDPQLVEITEYRIGASYYGLKQFDKARDSLTEFIRKFPQSKLSPDALFRLGRSYFEIANSSGDSKIAQTNLVEAVKIFERIRASHPQDERISEVIFQLGYLYSYIAENDKAIDMFAEFTKKWPDDRLVPEATYQIARNHVAAQRYDQAIAAFTELVRLFPNSELAPFAAYEIGTTYAAAKRPTDMLVTLRAYAEKYPNHARVGDALYAIGQQLESTQNFTEAIATYRVVVTKAATNPSGPMRDAAIGAELRLAALLETDSAIVNCEDFLAKFARDPVAARTAVSQLAPLYRKTMSLSDAFAKLDQLATRYQGNAAIRRAGATSTIELALSEKDYPRAYADALTLLPDSESDKLPAQSYLAIGNAMLKSRHYIEARDAFEKTLKFYPGDVRTTPLANLGLGQAYFGLKDLDQAEATFRKLLNADPQNLEAKLGLGKVYEAKGKVPEAIEMYDPVWRQGRGDAAAEAAFQMGMLAFRDKNYKAALPMFARLLFATGPLAEEAAYRAAQCHEALGSVEQARSAYQAYVRRFPGGTFTMEARTQLAKLPAPPT
jgi:TolA-binding protein